MTEPFEMRQSPTRRRQGTEPDKPAKVRNEPRITLNALAEYLTAAAGRRRTIVTEQKRPKGFQVVYYREAEDAIAQCLAAGGTDQRPLDSVLRRLRGGGGRNAWEQSRRDAGVEAVEAFRRWLDDPSADLGRVRSAPPAPRLLNVGSVSVSVRPELLVLDDDDNVVGGVKLYLSKNEALTEERARYSGTILHQYVQGPLGADARADWRRCYVLDVFKGRRWNASRTYTRRRQDVAAACAEIEVLWPRL